MYEYETFAYLDVQKTGSSFIARLLQTFAAESLVASRKHGRIRNPDPAKFYFTSCRDPLDQLLSLYFYGCSGSGHIRSAMEAAGNTAPYDGTPAGFDAFLRFVLDPGNADIFGEDYGKSGIAPLVGLMTFRFAVLSLPRPLRRLAACRTRDHLVAAYRTHAMTQEVVRAEALNDTMRDLIRGPLRTRLSDPAAAIAWIDSAERVNASRRRDSERDFPISDEAKRLIEEREWFLFDVLGYPRYLPARSAGILRRFLGGR